MLISRFVIKQRKFSFDTDRPTTHAELLIHKVNEKVQFSSAEINQNLCKEY